MPSEEVYKKEDLSRQLSLVLHGACNLVEDEKIKRVVQHDVSPLASAHCIFNVYKCMQQVPNMAPILGEIAFFLGTVQPMTVRARSDGDVQLLVLTKDDSNELFNNYPEQVQEILMQPC